MALLPFGNVVPKLATGELAPLVLPFPSPVTCGGGGGGLPVVGSSPFYPVTCALTRAVVGRAIRLVAVGPYTHVTRSPINLRLIIRTPHPTPVSTVLTVGCGGGLPLGVLSITTLGSDFRTPHPRVALLPLFLKTAYLHTG